MCSGRGDHRRRARDGTDAQPDATTRGNSLGCVFYTDNDIDVRLEQVERSQRYIRTSNKDATIARTVFDLSQTHAAGAAAGAMAYAIVPGADDGVLARSGESGPEVVQNSDDVHAVRHAGIGVLAVNTFTSGTHEIGNVTVDGPASVIAQNADQGRTVIAVSDPTFARETVSVILPGRRALLDQSHPDVAAHFQQGVTQLDIRTHHAYGATVTVTVRGHGVV